MFRNGKSFLAKPPGAFVAVALVFFLALWICTEVKLATTGNMSAEAVALRSFNQPRPALWEKVK